MLGSSCTGDARAVAGDALDRELLMRRHSHAGAVPSVVPQSAQHDHQQQQRQQGRVRFSWDTSHHQATSQRELQPGTHHKHSLLLQQQQQQHQQNGTRLPVEGMSHKAGQQHSDLHELNTVETDKQMGFPGGISLKDFSLASLASLSDHQRSGSSYSGGSLVNPRYSAGD